jgi:hypothetical protein
LPLPPPPPHPEMTAPKTINQQTTTRRVFSIMIDNFRF